MNREQAQCLLGLAADPSRKEVVSAHRRLISTVHPDKCSGPEAGRLARQATAARDVLLAPVKPPLPPRRQAPSASSSPLRCEQLSDDVLLRWLRVILQQLARPLDLAELLRTLRRDLRARGVPADDVRVCLARVLDADFLTAGVARGFWELHGDGVRPVGWTGSSAPAAVAGSQRRHRGRRGPSLFRVGRCPGPIRLAGFAGGLAPVCGRGCGRRLAGGRRSPCPACSVLAWWAAPVC